jgi:hypothetical protein
MGLRHAIHYLAADLEDVWIPSPDGLVAGVARDGATLVAVVDSGDETYVTASVPRVRGGYAARLLQRRLEREFPEASLRAAMTLRQRRRDGLTDIVLVAVAADAAIDANVSDLGAHCKLCAVTTPSLLVAAWLRRARLRPRRLLVVLPTPAGLRLVFIEDGQPSLSRLMPALDTTGATATEISRTIQYLQNTQRIEHDTALEIWFWGFQPAQVEACLPRDVPHVLGTAPRVPGLPDPGKDGIQALFASASASAPRTQLGSDRLRLRWFAHEARRWSLRAAAAVVLAAIAGSSAQLWRTQQVERETATMQAESSLVGTEQAALESQLASRNLSLEDVRVLPDLEQALRNTAVSFGEMATLVGNAVAAPDGIRLASLRFRSLPVSEELDPLARTCDGETLPPSPFAQVTFGMKDGLGVRARSGALDAVRQNLTQVAPWQATAVSAKVGSDEALTIAGGVEHGAGSAVWTLCLLRGDSA